MDPGDKRKITRYISMIKERIEDDIDPIMDKLIEMDTFTIQTKDEIDNVHPPTPQKKADMFIKKLLKCKHGAYIQFRYILLERGYHHLVNIMEGTQPRSADEASISSMVGDRESSFVLLSQTDASGGAAAAGGPISLGDLERMVTSLVDKTFEQKGNELKVELATELNKREKSMEEVMSSRLSSREEKIKGEVMAEVCAKESAIKETMRNEIEEKIAESQVESEQRLTAFDLTLQKLQELNEKYAHLQSVQDVLRKRIDDKEHRIKEMHRDKFHVAEEYQELKAEASRLREERQKLDNELLQMKNEMQKKDMEICRMKLDFDNQYLQMRQGFAEEQHSMKAGMKEQDRKLQRITKLMETLACTYKPKSVEVTELPKINKKEMPKPFMIGNSTPNTSHNKFVKRPLFSISYRK